MKTVVLKTNLAGGKNFCTNFEFIHESEYSEVCCFVFLTDSLLESIFIAICLAIATCMDSHCNQVMHIILAACTLEAYIARPNTPIRSHNFKMIVLL